MDVGLILHVLDRPVRDLIAEVRPLLNDRLPRLRPLQGRVRDTKLVPGLLKCDPGRGDLVAPRVGPRLRDVEDRVLQVFGVLLGLARKLGLQIPDVGLGLDDVLGIDLVPVALEAGEVGTGVGKLGLKLGLLVVRVDPGDRVVLPRLE